MSFGKAAGFSGIVAEVLKSADSGGASMIRDLIEDIIFENRMPSEGQKSHIVSVYKGKKNALNRSNSVATEIANLSRRFFYSDAHHTICILF